MSDGAGLAFRDEPSGEDLGRVRTMVDATGFFSPEEVAVAVELVDDRLARGPASDYQLLFADGAGGTLGYVCYGRIALTRASWDLYWIVVDPAAQGQGVGRALLAESERRIALAGAGAPQRIYVETSSRPQYQPTRRFYQGAGYQLAAELVDFYAPGDGKLIYLRVVGEPEPAASGPVPAPGSPSGDR